MNMSKSQWFIVVLFAVIGFSTLFTAIRVKSIMDEPAVIEPVVRMKETKEQLIDRIEHENLNRMYQSVLKPYHPAYQQRNIQI
jgi:uncharacterized protein YpmS